RDVAVSFASGNGGNKIYVVPSAKLVVAITSSAYGRGYGQRRSQAILLAILAALRVQLGDQAEAAPARRPAPNEPAGRGGQSAATRTAEPGQLHARRQLHARHQ